MVRQFKRYFGRYSPPIVLPRGVSRRYVLSLGSPKIKEIKNVRVITVDRFTLKQYENMIPINADWNNDEVLKAIRRGVKVGDFAILPDGKIFRRIRGGFREATDDDMAELITSQMK